MTDRAESILAAVATAVTGLTTTGTRVVRGRVYPVEAGGLPALSVNMGSESPFSEPNVAYQDEELTIEITAHVMAKEASGVDTALNKIRSEVYAAMRTTPTLGLAYVHDTRWQGRSTPQREDGGQQPVGRQTISFSVIYRHSYASSEA